MNMQNSKGDIIMRGTIIALIVFLIAIVLIVANFKKILRWIKQLIQ